MSNEFEKLFGLLEANSVGDFNSYYTNVTTEIPPKYPPYNIFEDKKENTYVLEIAVSGFSKKDIEINVLKDILTVKGNIKDKDTSARNYTCRNLSTRSFTSEFNLPKFTKIKEILLDKGILTITTFLDIPEEELPKEYKIK